MALPIGWPVASSINAHWPFGLISKNQVLPFVSAAWVVRVYARVIDSKLGDLTHKLFLCLRRDWQCATLVVVWRQLVAAC